MYMNMKSKICLLTLFLCVWNTSSNGQQPDCINPPGIVVTPSTNQTVPINTDTIVTYSCNVDNGRVANWELRGAQISVNSMARDMLANQGINITSGLNASEVFLSINRTGRERFPNLPIACYTFGMTELDIVTGCNYYVRTFEIPGIPSNLDLNPFRGDLSRLILTWDQPNNTLIETGDPVVTTYTVTVSGPTFNFTNTTTDTRYEIVDSLDEDCAMHNFQVYASNDAGVGPPDVINETIPISPDIGNLSAQLTVTDIILTTPLEIEVTFPEATACSTNFPLNSYVVNFIGVMDPVKFPATDPSIVGKKLITLKMNTILLPNQVYSLFVSACIPVTCRDSPVVTFMTTDVQSANIVFFGNNLYLTCSFASSSPARGCGFIFTASSNISEEFNVSQSESGLCAQLQNMENVYTSIMALDWESDGRYGDIPIIPTRNRVATEEEFMAATGCTPPTVPVAIVMELSGGAIAGIVLAVVAVVVIAAVIVIVIVFMARRKLEKAKTEKEEICLDCVPKEDVSVDSRANGQPMGALGGPPPPFQPKFGLELDRGHKNVKVSINKSMVDKLLAMMAQKDDDDIEYELPLLGEH